MSSTRASDNKPKSSGASSSLTKPSGSPKKNQKPAESTSSSNNNNGTTEIDESLPKNWTKIASKKRPGMFYYFNVKTQQSLWEHPGKTKALEEEEKIIRNVPKQKEVKKSPEKVTRLKNDNQFKRKNLAKERLDTLRKQLDAERKAEGEKKIVTKKETPKRKEAGKESKSPAKSPVVSPPENQKRKRVAQPPDKPEESPSRKGKISKVSPKSKAIVKKASPKVDKKQLEQQLEETKKQAQKRKSSVQSFKIPKKLQQEPTTSSIFVDIQKLDDGKTAVPDGNTLKTDSVPEQLPVPPIEVPKEEVKLPETATEPPKISNAQKLLNAIIRPPAICSPKVAFEPPAFHSTPRVQALIHSERSEQHVKSPANERLAGIREQLAQEVALQASLLQEDAEMTDLSDLLPDLDASESMDWEDIPEEVALREVVALRQAVGLKGPTEEPSIPAVGCEMHLFDRISFPRFFFMVLDTNIFLLHLKGVENLLAKGFPHIGQPILVIPYMVLQELDRIKHREQGQPLGQASSRSIRFLNNHLQKRDPRVKGQSTLEATNALIPIENADDNLINCCLQVRRAISGYPTELMLLSNDVNLRNKALVNGVQAFAYSELMAEADRIRFATDDETGAGGDGR